MPAFLTDLNPGWLLILAGLAAMFVKMRSVRQAITIITPVAAILLLSLLGLVLQGPVAALSGGYGSRYGLAGLHPEEAAILLGVSAGLGLLGAWVGAARQLRSIDPRSWAAGYGGTPKARSIGQA